MAWIPGPALYSGLAGWLFIQGVQNRDIVSTMLFTILNPPISTEAHMDKALTNWTKISMIVLSGNSNGSLDSLHDRRVAAI